MDTLIILKRATNIGLKFFILMVLAAIGKAQATLLLTDTSNITLTASQVESGDNFSENPDVTGGGAGSLVIYTASAPNGTCCGPDYQLSNLNDGDIGLGNVSDGSYAIPNQGDLTLTFDAGLSILSGIAIYNGYANRDTGTYQLFDDSSLLLGAWQISGTSGSANAGVDSFWLSFNSPINTASLTIRADSEQNNNTVSFREIQVFSMAVPEPATITIFALGFLGLAIKKRS